MDNIDIKNAAKKITLSDESKNRIIENAKNHKRPTLIINKGMIIGIGSAAAAVCIITGSVFALSGRGNISPSSTVSEPQQSSTEKTITEGYDGAQDGYGKGQLENSGGSTDFEVSISDDEGEESAAADHNTPSDGEKIFPYSGDWIATKWNGIYCDPILYKELSASEGTEEAYSINIELVKYDTDELMNYMYNGRSAGDYVKEVELYSDYVDGLQKIIQYSLGNGTPLYAVEEIDKAFSSQYLKDGSTDEYDIQKAESDLNVYREKIKDAGSLYDEAFIAFRREILTELQKELTAQSIYGEIGEDGLLHLTAGADQLSKLSISEPEKYCFMAEIVYPDIDNAAADAE